MDSHSRDRNHPVWDVYDQYRTARLNIKYYTAILARHRKIDSAMESIIAATAPTSAITGLWLWNTEIGKWGWKILAVIAGITAILKPLIRSRDKMRNCEEIITGYRWLHNDLEKINIQIKEKQIYDSEIRKEFSNVLDKKIYLTEKEPKSTINNKLRNRFTIEVNKELPSGDFYIPPKDKH